MVHPYTGILFSHKSNEVLIHDTAWINLENILLIERSVIQKDKYCMIPFLLSD